MQRLSRCPLRSLLSTGYGFVLNGNRGHSLYLRAVQLAAALQPAFPKGSWYKEATDAIQAHRDALQAEEAKKWENARGAILERLSEDISKMNDAKDMDDAGFANVSRIP